MKVLRKVFRSSSVPPTSDSFRPPWHGVARIAAFSLPFHLPLLSSFLCSSPTAQESQTPSFRGCVLASKTEWVWSKFGCPSCSALPSLWPAPSPVSRQPCNGIQDVSPIWWCERGGISWLRAQWAVASRCLWSVHWGTPGGHHTAYGNADSRCYCYLP